MSEDRDSRERSGEASPAIEPVAKESAAADSGGGPGASESATPDEPRGDPIRRITLIVALVAVLFFLWSVISDRLTPYSDQCRIQALVTPVVPQVSGYLTEVNVRLHSMVEQDELIFQIDTRPYQIAVASAEANLDLAAQQVGAQTATVKSATGSLGVARAQLDRAQRNYNRTQRILEANPGALSQADKDRAETALDQALERVQSAEAEVQRAKEQLGVEGSDNAQLRVAVTALEKAQLDLAFTSLHAPEHGAIESFNVDEGFYAQAGAPLASFVASGGMWIRADMRENNISNIEVGDPVEYILDAVPGRVFQGTVRSVGYGVSESGSTSRGELPTVQSKTGWLRDPQRFPVIIGLDSAPSGAVFRSGGQADVIVYTGEHPILNALGKLKIRLKTILSYVR